MQDHGQRGGEGIARDDQVGQPVDGVPGDRPGVHGQTVEQIAARIAVQPLPVRRQQTVKDLRLNVVVDPERDFCGDARGDAPQKQAAQRGDHHHGQHEPEPGAVVAGDDVDGVLAGQRGDEAQRRPGDAQHGIGRGGAAVAAGVGEDPFPVVQDLGKRPVAPAPEQNMQRLRPGILFFGEGLLLVHWILHFSGSGPQGRRKCMDAPPCFCEKPAAAELAPVSAESKQI